MSLRVRTCVRRWLEIHAIVPKFFSDTHVLERSLRYVPNSSPEYFECGDAFACVKVYARVFASLAGGGTHESSQLNMGLIF